MSSYKDFISLEVTGIEEALTKVGPAFVENIKASFTDARTLQEIGTTLMALEADQPHTSHSQQAP